MPARLDAPHGLLGIADEDEPRLDEPDGHGGQPDERDPVAEPVDLVARDDVEDAADEQHAGADPPEDGRGHELRTDAGARREAAPAGA